MPLGTCSYNDKNFLLVDIPGTYSLMSNSQEEEIARDYICFGNPDATVVILDAIFTGTLTAVSTVTMCPIGANPNPSSVGPGHICSCMSEIKTSVAIL